MRHDIGNITECHISIAHPRGDSKRLEGCEPRNFAAGKQVPYNGRQRKVVTDDQTASSSFADIIDTDKGDAFLMQREPSLNRERIMVQTKDHRALRIQEQRRCRGTWLEVGIPGPLRLRRDGRRGRLRAWCPRPMPGHLRHLEIVAQRKLFIRSVLIRHSAFAAPPGRCHSRTSRVGRGESKRGHTIRGRSE
jgi:hypothetical protein